MITIEAATGVARQMAASANDLDVQVAQTHFRMQLVEGWQIPQGAKVKDADWEIDSCLRSSLAEAETLNLPAKLLELLGSQVETLRLMAGKGKNRSLPSYSIVATQST